MQSTDAHIYVISDGAECKIGVSSAPERRIEDFQGASSQRLSLIYVSPRMVRSAARRVEYAAHAMLSSAASSGGDEWFRVDENRAISTVQDLLNDPAKLRSFQKKRGRPSKVASTQRHRVVNFMTDRVKETANDVAEVFGISRSTAYRIARDAADAKTRMRELKLRKGPVAELVLDNGERIWSTKRAADAYTARHAELAKAWRVWQDDKAEFLRTHRVRVAKSDGPWHPVTFRVPFGPPRYSISVTFGPRPSAAQPAADLPPWPLPWEPMHPTEAAGQLFRNAIRNRPLPTAAIVLSIVDNALAALNTFRGMLTEPGTGPPETPSELAAPT